MFKFVTRILCALSFFTALAINASAQHQDSTIVTSPDSVDMILDSMSEKVSVGDSAYQPEEYTDENEETLYFSGKEDSLSLYDSSLLTWRKVPDTTMQALQADKDFWYANKDRKQKKKKQDEATDDSSSGVGDFLAELLSSKTVRQAIFVFILLLFLLAVIWFLVKNKMNLFGRGRGKIAVDQPLNGEPENIFAANRQAAIKSAEANEDYRLAIRLSYLFLLRKFSEEGWIKYKEDTTNMEYMAQLYSQPFYKEFFTVTRSYEYVWYGEMPVNKLLYDKVQQDFAILYTKAALSI